MGASVKICGLKNVEMLEAAIDAGASHFGLIFFPPSPRSITPADAARLASAARRRIISVALTVDAADDLLTEIISAVDPDMIQCHGSETPERIGEIRQKFEKPVIKSIGVAKVGDAERAFAYKEVADLILFDAKPSAVEGRTLPGGNGFAFDWRLLASVKGAMPFMLSGGLSPANVGEAIRMTGAEIVDVSSGVESAPGEKDAALIQQFVEAARKAVLEEAANG